MITRFLNEVKLFTKSNWWIYLIYLALIISIILDKKSVLSVIIISLIHFTADILIMMMFSSYTQKKFNEGTKYQIISMLLFTSLKLYTGFIGNGWHYLAADPIYLLAAVKNYRTDLLNKNTRLVNPLSLSVISVLMFLFILIPLNVFVRNSQWVQTIGIYLFAIALATNGNTPLRYKLSILALFLMVNGSAWETYNTWKADDIVGLALSYFLLPLTVFIFYIRTWHSMNRTLESTMIQT